LAAVGISVLVLWLLNLPSRMQLHSRTRTIPSPGPPAARHATGPAAFASTDIFPYDPPDAGLTRAASG
jgi:hypothetical protein